jgi:hypothetical protein
VGHLYILRINKKTHLINIVNVFFETRNCSFSLCYNWNHRVVHINLLLQDTNRAAGNFFRYTVWARTPLWQNHLRNEKSVFQNLDQVILDEAKMHANTYEAFKIIISLKIKLLHFNLKITRMRDRRYFKR